VEKLRSGVKEKLAHCRKDIHYNCILKNAAMKVFNVQIFNVVLFLYTFNMVIYCINICKKKNHVDALPIESWTRK